MKPFRNMHNYIEINLICYSFIYFIHSKSRTPSVYRYATFVSEEGSCVFLNSYRARLYLWCIVQVLI